MKNLQYYKRILAGVVCATMLLSNLGATTQVAFAAETSDAVTEDTGSEEIAVQEAPAEESAVSETPAEDTSYSNEEEISVESTEDEDIAPVSEENEEPVQEITETGSTGEESTEHSEDKTEESSTEATTEKEETEVEETKTVEESGSTASTEKAETTTEKKETSTETTTEQSEAASTETTEEKAEETKETEEESKASEHSKDWYYTRELTCKEEHEHTDDCYKVTKELSCKEDHEHTADCYKAIEETKEIEESGEAEVKTITYEVHTSGIKVTAVADENALPDGAQLKAHRIKDESDLEKVTEELDNSDVDYDDYIALDVYFQTMYGEEIEPDGTVQVTFELEESTLNDINADSVSVQHFDESQDKTEVVTVADTTSNDSTGTVEVQNADNTNVDTAVKAEFEVESFSTFTITWKSDSAKKGATILVTAVDANGHELKDSSVPSKIELSSGETVELNSSNSKLQPQKKDTDTGSTSGSDTKKSFDHAEATVTDEDGNQVKYSNVTSITANYDKNDGWTYTIVADGEEIKDITEGNLQLTLVYKATDNSLSFNLNGGSGTAPSTIYGQAGTDVILPTTEEMDKLTYKNGYTFIGWCSSSSATASGKYNAFYAPGAKYTLAETTSSEELYAIWSNNNQSTTAGFFLRSDNTIPAEPHTHNSDQYTNGVTSSGQVTYELKNKQWIIDTNAAGTKSGIYIVNDVYSNLNWLPTVSTMISQINTLYKNDPSKQVEQDGSGGMVLKGTSTHVYILWYALKYQGGYGITNNRGNRTTYGGDGNWNVDGVLIYENEVTVVYDGNPNNECPDPANDTTDAYHSVPEGYSKTLVDGKATITIGADTEGNQHDVTRTTASGATANYTFVEWNTKPDGTGQGYRPGQKIDISENLTLYAIWAKAKTGGLRVTKALTGRGEDQVKSDTEFTVRIAVLKNYVTGEETAKKHSSPDDEGTTIDGFELSGYLIQNDDTSLFEWKDNGSGTTADSGEYKRLWQFYDVKLKDGESIEIQGLEDGAIYRIEEQNPGKRYTVTYDNYTKNDDANNRIESEVTKAVLIRNDVRVVKTGVELGGTPVEAIAAIIVIASMCGLVYWKGRRYVQ